MRITSSDILDALRASLPSPDAGFRMVDAAEAMGVSTRTAAMRVQQLHRMGLIETVPISVEAINGRTYRMIGYRLKTKAKAKR